MLNYYVCLNFPIMIHWYFLRYYFVVALNANDLHFVETNIFWICIKFVFFLVSIPHLPTKFSYEPQLVVFVIMLADRTKVAGNIITLFGVNNEHITNKQYTSKLILKIFFSFKWNLVGSSKNSIIQYWFFSFLNDVKFTF